MSSIKVQLHNRNRLIRLCTIKFQKFKFQIVILLFSSKRIHFLSSNNSRLEKFQSIDKSDGRLKAQKKNPRQKIKVLVISVIHMWIVKWRKKIREFICIMSIERKKNETRIKNGVVSEQSAWNFVQRKAANRAKRKNWNLMKNCFSHTRTRTHTHTKTVQCLTHDSKIA